MRIRQRFRLQRPTLTVDVSLPPVPEGLHLPRGLYPSRPLPRPNLLPSGDASLARTAVGRVRRRGRPLRRRREESGRTWEGATPKKKETPLPTTSVCQMSCRGGDLPFPPSGTKSSSSGVGRCPVGPASRAGGGGGRGVGPDGSDQVVSRRGQWVGGRIAGVPREQGSPGREGVGAEGSLGGEDLSGSHPRGRKGGSSQPPVRGSASTPRGFRGIPPEERDLGSRGPESLQEARHWPL